MNISLWTKGAMKIALFSAAFALSGTGVAVAGTGTTSGAGSIGGGNQVNLPISVPVDICGNAIAILGVADAGCVGGASVTSSGGGGLSSNSDRWSTSGVGSALGGNQVNAPVSIPVSACGNAVGAVLGHASARCRGGAKVTSGHDSSWSPGGDAGTTPGDAGDTGNAAASTSGDNSLLGGNQVNLPISVPVDVCGNAIAILGVADAGCVGGASVTSSGGGGLSSNSDRWSTSGVGSALGGNQVNAPVSIPVSACGNAVGAVLGHASARCRGGAKVTSGHDSSWSPGGDAGSAPGDAASTSGDNSLLGGNQVNLPISVPVDVCGNAIALLGVADAACAGGASVTRGDSPDSGWTSGDQSLGGGNQITAPVGLPVVVCGNAIGGHATAICAGGASVSSGGGSGSDCPCGNGPGGSTSGDRSILGGNQFNVPVSAPVGICGNAVAVLSTATAACKGGSAVASPPPHHGCTSSQQGCCQSSQGFRFSQQGCCQPWQGSRSSQAFKSWQHVCCPPPAGVAHAGGFPSSLCPPAVRPVSHRTAPRSAPGAPRSSPGVLPTTGADLVGLVVIGLGAIVAGAVSLVMMRRRRVTGRI
jgi:LPXTG-motif cell wall-anchored protein